MSTSNIVDGRCTSGLPIPVTERARLRAKTKIQERFLANATAEQVQEIVKAYESQYFPSCEKYKVRILWEPYVNPANIATSPVAFAALLRAFNGSPYVGIQMDPSHLAWQIIDPVEATAAPIKERVTIMLLSATKVKSYLTAYRRTNGAARAAGGDS